MKSLHVFLMATWFGTALSVSFLWHRRQSDGSTTPDTQILALIRRLEGTGSLLLPLTGAFILIPHPEFLAAGWLYIKIGLWGTALALSHLSRSCLKKIMAGAYDQQRVFELLRSGMLLCLIIAVVMVHFKPV
jgi:uncharacterized membrane protein